MPSARADKSIDMEDRRQTGSSFVVGQPFCPRNDHCGCRPPDVVDRIQGLRDGPKRLYRLLCRRAGSKDYCWPSIALLAADVGKCQRQVLYDVGELERRGFISRKRGGTHRSTTYYILWHVQFERASP